MRLAIERASADAHALDRAGFDAILVENFGDAPFFADETPAVTVAAMTACALAVREAAPGLVLGVNVLRNDAKAALAVAAVTGASFIRVNVLSGARVTDQGIVEGKAAEVMRMRASLAKDVRVFADVFVKHSAALASRPLEEEIAELVERALADAVLVTGSGTGVAPLLAEVEKARRAASTPLFVASGATENTARTLLAHCDGIIVGTAIKRGRRAGGPVDASLAKGFVRSCRRA